MRNESLGNEDELGRGSDNYSLITNPVLLGWKKKKLKNDSSFEKERKKRKEEISPQVREESIFFQSVDKFAQHYLLLLRFPSGHCCPIGSLFLCLNNVQGDTNYYLSSLSGLY